MSELEKQLEFEEGRRLKVYLCTEGYRTIGVGRNLDANPYFEGNLIPDEITDDECDAILAHDIRRTTERLHAAWHGMGLLEGARRDAVIQMAFQMGVDGLLGFRRMLRAMLQCDWRRAREEALDSKWARQTPNRARRVARQILTGEYYPIPS